MLELRDYQKKAVDFLLDHPHALLYDQMGLGKTFEVSYASRMAVKDWTVGDTILVICPTYLMRQWEDFLHSQWPDDSVQVVTGHWRQRIDQLVQRANWTIVNKEMVRAYNLILAVDPTVVIIDEAHHFRGNSGRDPKNLTAQSLLKMAKKVPYIYLVTGTPIYRETDDLFSLLRIIDHHKYTSYWNFVTEYCKVVNTPWGHKVVGTKDRSRIQDLLRTYGIGRSYTEVGLELPSLIERNIGIELEPTLRARYDKVKKSYRDGDEPIDSAVAVLRRLRLLTSISIAKKEALSGLLADIPPQDRVLIFTWYRESASEVYNHMTMFTVTGHSSSDCTMITGFQDPVERGELAKSHQYVIATMASLSEGIDLSDMRHVIFWEEPYENGMHDQALARVLRLRFAANTPDGTLPNTDPVNVYYMLCNKSVDIVVHRMRVRRQNNISEIMREALKDDGT